MRDTAQALACGGTVASQLIGDDDSWNVREIFELLAQELFPSRLIPAAPHEDIKDVPLLIDGTPAIVACAVDPHKHLVQVPCVPGSRTSASQLIGVLLHELQTPLTDRFICHNDPTGEPELFDIMLAEARTEIQPDTMTDDLRWEAVVFIAVGWNDGVHATIMAHRPGAV